MLRQPVNWLIRSKKPKKLLTEPERMLRKPSKPRLTD